MTQALGIDNAHTTADAVADVESLGARPMRVTSIRELTVPGPGGDLVFTGEASAVFRLLRDLDRQYRQHLQRG